MSHDADGRGGDRTGQRAGEAGRRTVRGEGGLVEVGGMGRGIGRTGVRGMLQQALRHSTESLDAEPASQSSAAGGTATSVPPQEPARRVSRQREQITPGALQHSRGARPRTVVRGMLQHSLRHSTESLDAEPASQSSAAGGTATSVPPQEPARRVSRQREQITPGALQHSRGARPRTVRGMLQQTLRHSTESLDAEPASQSSAAGGTATLSSVPPQEPARRVSRQREQMTGVLHHSQGARPRTGARGMLQQALRHSTESVDASQSSAAGGTATLSPVPPQEPASHVSRQREQITPGALHHPQGARPRTGVRGMLQQALRHSKESLDVEPASESSATGETATLSSVPPQEPARHVSRQGQRVSLLARRLIQSPFASATLPNPVSRLEPHGSTGLSAEEESMNCNEILHNDAEEAASNTKNGQLASSPVPTPMELKKTLVEFKDHHLPQNRRQRRRHSRGRKRLRRSSTRRLRCGRRLLKRKFESRRNEIPRYCVCVCVCVCVSMRVYPHVFSLSLSLSLSFSLSLYYGCIVNAIYMYIHT